MEISARNGLKGKIEDVKLGEVMASVKTWCYHCNHYQRVC